jgi:hypothetical protein
MSNFAEEAQKHRDLAEEAWMGLKPKEAMFHAMLSASCELAAQRDGGTKTHTPENALACQCGKHVPGTVIHIADAKERHTLGQCWAEMKLL